MSTELTLRNPDLEPCNWCHFRIIPLCCQVLKQHPSSLILDAHLYPFVVIIQLLSRIWLFATPWTVARQAPLSSPISQSLLKIMSVESVMLSNYLILCCLLPLLPSIFPSIRVFSNELAFRIKWPKYQSFNFSIRRVFYSTSFFIILSFLLNAIFHHFLLVFLLVFLQLT